MYRISPREAQVAGGFQAFFPSYAARSEAHPGFTLSATQKSTSCHVVRAPLFGASAAHRQWEDLLVAVLLLQVFLWVSECNGMYLIWIFSGPISNISRWKCIIRFNPAMKTWKKGVLGLARSSQWMKSLWTAPWIPSRTGPMGTDFSGHIVLRRIGLVCVHRQQFHIRKCQPAATLKK